MMVFRRKQVVVLSLVLMIVVAGYLQYSYKKSSASVSDKNGGKLGEAVYVDSKDSSIKTQNNDKASKAVTASKQANEFFAQAKLEREVTRGKDTDALKGISNDPNAAKEVKAKAYEKTMKLADNSQKEMRIETLVKDKGYEDVVAMMGDDGSIDIVIKTPSLTSAQATQIADIASRQGNITMSQIHIRNIF